MRAVDLIHAKRLGLALAPEAIAEFVRDYTRGKIPDYQASAFLMAVFFRGLSPAELAALTDAMMRSGEMFDLSPIDAPTVDKHSTGGVGDKVSLILAPLAAACGLCVPMVAGRGLGHTGGTLDKLEAIPGFRVDLSSARFRRQLAKIGVGIIGQTKRFVPADKKLYALRDVTATVESIPLIAASIMSKKLAEGCQGLVLDVKAGSGAFMTDRRRAEELARTMIGLGEAMGRKVRAVLSDMEQPTGTAIGNANEVLEALAALEGRWPVAGDETQSRNNLKTITFALTGRMLVLGGLAANLRAAEPMMEQAVASGAARERFAQMIAAQGGDARIVDDPKRLKLAPHEAVIASPRAGWLASVATRKLGIAAAILGAGRQRQDDAIDPGVGLFYESRVGARVEPGQPLLRVRYRSKSAWAAAETMLHEAFVIGDSRTLPPKTIIGEL